jgi:hypothetical protein
MKHVSTMVKLMKQLITTHTHPKANTLCNHQLMFPKLMMPIRIATELKMPGYKSLLVYCFTTVLINN